jgi:triosephosphate isomerase (TIM)
LTENASEDVAKACRVIYGGSASAGNCAALIEQGDIDGFLVGGASLKADFKTIIETANAKYIADKAAVA